MVRERVGCLVAGMAIAMAGFTVVAAPAAHAGPGVGVFVAYADSQSASVFFPAPFDGSPNVNFVGSPTSPTPASPAHYDAGVIRLDNPTGSPIAVDAVSVDVGPSAHYALWPCCEGSLVIPANDGTNDGHLILTQTNGQENFDTSDVAHGSCGSPSDIKPVVHVTIAGQTTDYTDSQKVLTTFGVDKSACDPPNPGTGMANESVPFAPIGQPVPAPTLSVPGPQSVHVNDPLSFTVSASNGVANDPLVLTASGLPSGMTFSAPVTNGSASGAVSGSPTSAGLFPVVFTVTDGFNPPVTATVNITVTSEELPTITVPAAQTVEVTDPLSFNVTTAADLDGDGTALTAAGLPAGTTFGATSSGGVVTGTVSGVPTVPGVYTVTFSVGDDPNPPVTNSVVVTVIQEETQLVAQPAIAEIGPGLRITFPNLSATLTDPDDPAPVAGKTVTFTSGTTFVCAAVTDANGTATCGGIVQELHAILGLGYQATFAGDFQYVPSSAHGSLVILFGIHLF